MAVKKTVKTAKKAATKKVNKKTVVAEVVAEKPVEATPDTKLADISKAIEPLKVAANKIVIKNDDDVQAATEVLVKTKAYLKRVEENRKFFVDPLTKHVRDINARFKIHSAALESIETYLKRVLGDYALEQEKKRREAEAKLQAQHQKQVEKAEAKGKPVEYGLTPTVPKAPTITRAESGGSASNSLVWKFELGDIKELVLGLMDKPELIKFLSFNEKAIRGAVAEGARDIPGVRIYEDIEVSVRTE